MTCSFDLCRTDGRIYTRGTTREEAGDCRLVIFLGVYFIIIIYIYHQVRHAYNTEIIIDRLSAAAACTRPLTRTRDLFLTFTCVGMISHFFIASLFWPLKLKGAFCNHYRCYCCCDVRTSDKGWRAGMRVL